MAFSNFTSRLSKLDKIANVFQRGVETSGCEMLLTSHPLRDLTSLVEVLLELWAEFTPSLCKVATPTHELYLCSLVVHGGRDARRG